MTAYRSPSSIGATKSLGLSAPLARRACFALATVIASWPLLISSSALAQQSAAAPVKASEPTEAETEEQARPKLLALGEFHVRDLRPTRNETVDVRFSLFAVLPSNTSPAALTTLGRWRQRLRDQVIIAVRLAETKDFVEPGLDRLHQILLMRINRVLGRPLVQAMYVNDFAYGDQ